MNGCLKTPASFLMYGNRMFYCNCTQSSLEYDLYSPYVLPLQQVNETMYTMYST